jgi:hypothetical protein
LNERRRALSVGTSRPIRISTSLRARRERVHGPLVQAVEPSGIVT